MMRRVEFFPLFLSLSLPFLPSSFGSFNHRRKVSFRDYASYGIVHIEFFRDYTCRSRLDHDRFFREGRIWGRLRFDDARDLAKIEGCIVFHVTLHPSSSIVSFSLLLFFFPPLFFSFALVVYDEYNIKTSKNASANRRNYFLLLRARNNDHYITPACLTRRNWLRYYRGIHEHANSEKAGMTWGNEWRYFYVRFNFATTALRDTRWSVAIDIKSSRAAIPLLLLSLLMALHAKCVTLTVTLYLFNSYCMYLLFPSRKRK